MSYWATCVWLHVLSHVLDGPDPVAAPGSCVLWFLGLPSLA